VSATPVQGQQYAGQRLGLPATGPGSIAGWGRRILALYLDWLSSWAVAALIVSLSGATVPTTVATLAVFWLETSIGTALVAGSFGQVAVRIAVRRVDGRLLDPAGALLRGLLICMVVPPVIYNRDNRGLHDLAVRSIVVNR
jgi:uncharacterized RDD family membrane protein YckC